MIARLNHNIIYRFSYMLLILYLSICFFACTTKLQHIPSGSKFYETPNPLKVGVLLLENKTDHEYRNLWATNGPWGFEEEPHLALSQLIFNEIKSLGLFSSVEKIDILSSAMANNSNKLLKEHKLDAVLVGELYAYKAGGAPHVVTFILPSSLLWIPGVPIVPGYWKSYVTYDLRLIDLHNKKTLWRSGRNTSKYENDLVFGAWTTDSGHWKEINQKLVNNLIGDISNSLVDASTKGSIMAQLRQSEPIDSLSTPLSENVAIASSSIMGQSSTISNDRFTRKSDIHSVPNFYSIPRTNDVAVVIGIENYQNIAQTSDYSYNDANLIQKYLKALGFQERNIVYLTNERASLSGLRKAFEAWLPNHVNKASKVFIYYSGHGAPDTQGNGYLVPYDGDPNYLDVTGYSLNNLYANLEKLEADEIIVVMDSCFSGAGGKSVLPNGARPISIEVKNPILLSNKVAILSSSRMNQISTSYPAKELGLLTYHFLTALKDGKMTLFDIYKYVEPMVEDEAQKMNIEQSPQLMPEQNISGKAFSLR